MYFVAPGLTKEKGDLRSDEAEGRSPFSFVPQRRFAPGVAEGNRRPFGVPGEYYISSTLRVNPHRGSIVQCTIPILFRRDVLLQRFSLFSMGKGLAVRRFFWVETCGDLWKLVETCGNLWELVEACGSVWKLVGTSGSSGRRPLMRAAPSDEGAALS